MRAEIARHNLHRHLVARVIPHTGELGTRLAQANRAAARIRRFFHTGHIRAHTGAISLVTVCGMPKAATPWGQTEVLEELTVPQRAGEKRFATIVQLLADAKGDELVRFAYSTGGTARRGPVTLRARDLERLRSALAEHPGLARALGLANGRA